MYFESKRLDVDSPAKKINQFVESNKCDERTSKSGFRFGKKTTCLLIWPDLLLANKNIFVAKTI